MEQLKSLAIGAHSVWGSSKEFQDLVKSIGESKSRAEEDRIVKGEIEILKRRINEPDIPKRKMKEFLLRLVYVEMLGHDASFGYIHAVKMAHDENLLLKKTGYLAVTLFLNDSHDLIILIVNTIQKDLKSDNHLIVCAALGAVCKLINSDTIPAVLPQVLELLNHPKESVRKKAVMALHRFFQRSPSSVSHLIPRFRQVLCDKDPSVMSAAICALRDLIISDPLPFKSLSSSFVSILKQVAESRLPNTFNYHKCPAPFIQIKLLKILALLGANDKNTSENMYTVISDVIRRADSTVTIGNAILYECICTITSIYPNNKLLVACAEITSRFLKSDIHNLKYMGIDALARIVKINLDFANEHQIAVIDCLEDPDETLKRKTLDLLYRMTKANNVVIIVEKMISYMRSVHDTHGKTEIASKIIDLAERFAPTNEWFIQTMNSVFETAGDFVKPKVAHDLMRLIAEGSGENDENADLLLRSSAVNSYLKLLDEPNLPSILLKIICWVFGEYGTVNNINSIDDVVYKLCEICSNPSSDDRVKSYAITAIMKLMGQKMVSSHSSQIISEAQSLVNELLASHSTDLQQRAYELQSILGLSPQVVSFVLPPDASCEDIEVDEDLSFLNSFVEEAMNKGALPYIPENERMNNSFDSSSLHQMNSNNTTERALRFEAYSKPVIPTPSSISSSPSPFAPPAHFPQERNMVGNELALYEEHGGRHNDQSASDSTSRLQLSGVNKKWGRNMHANAASTSVQSENKEIDSSKPKNASSTASSSSVIPYSDKKRTDNPVSKEKQLLAASLFGGDGSSLHTGSGLVVGVKASRSVQRSKGEDLVTNGETVIAEDSKSQLKSSVKVESPPIMDLLDLSDFDSSSHLPPKPDPLKELEGLLDMNLSVTETQGLSSSLQQMDMASITLDPSLGVSSNGKESDKVVGGIQSVEKKQNNVKLKNAMARNAGIVNYGALSPELFSDISK